MNSTEGWHKGHFLGLTVIALDCGKVKKKKTSEESYIN